MAETGVQGAADKIFELSEQLIAIDGEMNQFGRNPTAEQLEAVRKQIRDAASVCGEVRTALTGQVTPPPPPTSQRPEAPAATARTPGVSSRTSKDD